jgi:hypothetical protein
LRRPHAGTEPAFGCIQCSMLPEPMSSPCLRQLIHKNALFRQLDLTHSGDQGTQL